MAEEKNTKQKALELAIGSIEKEFGRGFLTEVRTLRDERVLPYSALQNLDFAAKDLVVQPGATLSRRCHCIAIASDYPNWCPNCTEASP